MIKIINLVAVIIAPMIVQYGMSAVTIIITLGSLTAIVWAIRRSKEETPDITTYTFEPEV